jgi:hypothetical protein
MWSRFPLKSNPILRERVYIRGRPKLRVNTINTDYEKQDIQAHGGQQTTNEEAVCVCVCVCVCRGVVMGLDSRFSKGLWQRLVHYTNIV